MAKRTAPAAEVVEETTEPESNEVLEGEDLSPEEQAFEDLELAKQLGLVDEDGNVIDIDPSPPQPRKVTIREIFEQSVALVASASGKRVVRVSESTATKLYELSLFWALNNRNQPMPPVMDTEDIDASA